MDIFLSYTQSIKQQVEELHAIFWSWFQLDKFKEAIECFNQAIQLNPQLTIAYINKGLALNELEKYRKAIKCFDEAILLKSIVAYNHK